MIFRKYNCLGNDFIITDDLILNVRELCDNHIGIGADGLIINDGCNFLFFNKDGTKASFCGNGIRCAMKYLVDTCDYDKEEISFENKIYTVYNEDNGYILKYPVTNVVKLKKYYLVDAGVKHLIVMSQPTLKLAKKLRKKYDCNITFYFNNYAKTYEKGVGFTRGCGSGLIAIMNVLYSQDNITEKVIFSESNKSVIFVKDGNVYLNSEVNFIYKGEMIN